MALNQMSNLHGKGCPLDTTYLTHLPKISSLHVKITKCGLFDGSLGRVQKDSISYEVPTDSKWHIQIPQKILYSRRKQQPAAYALCINYLNFSPTYSSVSVTLLNQGFVCNAEIYEGKRSLPLSFREDPVILKQIVSSHIGPHHYKEVSRR